MAKDWLILEGNSGTKELSPGSLRFFEELRF